MEQKHNGQEKRVADVKAYWKRILPEDAFFFDSGLYPTNPGCYLMKDRRGTVIYVGKAKNLRDRLGSYFQSRHKDPKIVRMVQRVRSIEVILVNNELESLVLENNLIKLHKPHYNARLKDDDSGYYYIVQTTEVFPRLLPYTRNGYSKEIERIRGNAIERRFGPYLNRRFRDLLLEFVVDHFGFRTCAPLQKQSCLRHEIQRCCGVCIGWVSSEEYTARLEEAAVFLSYEKADIFEHTMQEMKRRMQAHADRLEFECAQRVYQKVEAMEKLRVKQIVECDLAYDQDVIWFGESSALVMRLVKGAVMRLDWHSLNISSGFNSVQEEFIRRWYCIKCPAEIIVNCNMSSPDVEEYLSSKNGYTVRITGARTVKYQELLDLCRLNYEYRAAILSMKSVIQKTG
jgi:excinuclease ABC subunit C